MVLHTNTSSIPFPGPDRPTHQLSESSVRPSECNGRAYLSFEKGQNLEAASIDDNWMILLAVSSDNLIGSNFIRSAPFGLELAK